MTASSPSLDTVFSWIAARRGRCVERLADYVRRPSVSATGEGVLETAAFIAGDLERLGLPARTIATPGWPAVLARRADAPNAPTVLFYGHYDVQPPDPLDQWTAPPFTPEVRAGRLYGRGAADNKGQHLAVLLGIEAWLACHGRLPCNVAVLLEGEEEIGSTHLAEVVGAQAGDLRADLVVMADGSVHESGQPTLVFGVRGIAAFELRAKHAARDVHSGSFGGVAPNPLWTLVHLLGTMKNDRGEITIAGFGDAIRPLSEAERAALAALPDDPERLRAALGLERFDAPAGLGLGERVMARPTLTINGLHGGYGGPGSKTVLPREAVAKCDARLVPNQTVAGAMAAIRAHVARHAPDVEVIPRGGMDPSRTPLDSPWADPLRRAVRAAQGVEPLTVLSLGGSLPAYVFTGVLGAPTFGLPSANADSTIHAPDENLDLEWFVRGIRTAAALLAELGGRTLGARAP